jgi:hypothetical protein
VLMEKDKNAKHNTEELWSYFNGSHNKIYSNFHPNILN